METLYCVDEIKTRLKRSYYSKYHRCVTHIWHYINKYKCANETLRELCTHACNQTEQGHPFITCIIHGISNHIKCVVV